MKPSCLILALLWCGVFMAGCPAGGPGPSSGGAGSIIAPVIAPPVAAPVPDTPSDMASAPPASGAPAAANGGPTVLGPPPDAERVLPQVMRASLHYGDGFTQYADNLMDGSLSVPAGAFTLPLRAEIYYFDGVRVTMDGPIPAGVQLRLLVTTASGGPPYFYRDVKTSGLQPEGYDAVFKELALPPGELRLAVQAHMDAGDPVHFSITPDFTETLTPMTPEAYDQFMRSAGWTFLAGLLPTSAVTPSDSPR